MIHKSSLRGFRPAMMALGLVSVAGLLAFGGRAIAEGETGSPAGPSCLEDSLEENDTQETATAVAFPFDEDALRVCPGDSDWFSFVLAAGDQVQVDASFDQALGDVDIALYNQRGDLVRISDTGDDFEKMTYAAPASGTYAVEVYLFRDPPATGNTYALRIAAPAPARLGDVNCNSLINSIDAALVLQLVARLVPTLACRDAADVNLDSGVDSRDATLILQFDAGLIAHLPP